MSAARFPLSRNAATIRSVTAEYLGEVLVAAPRQRDEVQPAVAWIRERPRERVRGLERRDDSFEARHPAEGSDRLVVGHGHIAGAPLVAHPGVLRTGTGVVEAGRDGVRLEDLTLL